MPDFVLMPACRAGSYGRALLDGSGEGLAVEPWQVALGLGFTVLALGYLGRVAKEVGSPRSFASLEKKSLYTGAWTSINVPA